MLVAFGFALLLADECRKAIVRRRRSQSAVNEAPKRRFRITRGNV